MNNEYTPQVGDRVRRHYWRRGYIDVQHVGNAYFMGINSAGEEVARRLDEDWVKVGTPAPLPDFWSNVDRWGVAGIWRDRAGADKYAINDRLAVVHIYTDADGVDHADIHRVTP
jgi:hypothetical protein